MPVSYITIQRSDHEALLSEVKRGVEVCEEVANLRILLQTVLGRLDTRVDKIVLTRLVHAIEACDGVARLRTELAALERCLHEFDEDRTPQRPPSRSDIQIAFANSVEFAQGKRKPPRPSG